jgi:PAS domain S-box-containing protein
MSMRTRSATGMSAVSGDESPVAAKAPRLVVAATLAFVLLLLAAAALDLWRGRQAAASRAEREIDTLARVLAEQARRTMQAVDIVTREIGRAYRAGELPPPRSRELHEYLRAQAAALPDIPGIVLVDAAGDRFSGATYWPSPPLNVASLDIFRRAAAGKSERTYTGGVIPGLRPGNWIVPFAYRLERADGQFDGAVLASLDARYFDAFYRQIDLGTGRSIRLVTDHGLVAAGHPDVSGERGQPNVEFEAALQATARLDDAAGYAVDGGRLRLGAARRMPGYPYYVLVSQDVTDALAPWRANALGTIVRTVLLACAAIVLLFVVLRQLRRLEAARARLATSEERYALAVSGANDGLWDWDLRRNALYYSPRAQQLLGVAGTGPDTRRPEAWAALARFADADRADQKRAIDAYLRGERPTLEGEWCVRLPDDGERWIRVRGVCVRDAAGTPLRMAGSFEDVTPRKAAERERLQLETQLRQSHRLEAMGTLAGGVAHDFNNILGAIVGHAELAQLQIAPDSRAGRHLAGILQAGARARALVRRILTFSRPDEAARMPIDLQAVVEEAVDLLAASAPPGIRLQTRLCASGETIAADATQLHQVVMNLGTNAVHAMHGHGVLELTLERIHVHEPRTLSSGRVASGDWLVLTVRDTGPGIDPAHLARIFEPFFTTRGTHGGTGLGLSLVQGIVTECGGAIELTSRTDGPEHGTTFSVFLPRDGRPAIGPTRAPLATLPRGHGEAVLIVDDEEPLRRVAEELLTDLGYAPAAFAESEAALDEFRAAPDRYALVLTDEALPRMSGSQLAAAIRALDADVPIVMMSGYASDELEARARAVGAAGVLAKPLVAAELATLLARVLGTRTPAS